MTAIWILTARLAMDESKIRLRSLDVFMGLGFLAVGAFVAYDGFIAFYAPQLVTVEKASNPGVSTIFIGALMGLLGLVIAAIGLLGSGHPLRIAQQAVSETLRSKAFYKGVIALACIAVYFFVFWDRIPYVVSTFLFLAGMMAVFKAGAWWKIALIAGTTVAIVWYVFGVLAMIPLP
jgi:hypothetical protein